MFDLGFSELLLIAAVALVVLGPERLPKVARMAGLWVGRIQNFISNVKTDLSNQAGMAEFKAARDSIEQTAQQLRQDVHQQVADVRAEVDDLQQAVGELDGPVDGRLPDENNGAEDHHNQRNIDSAVAQYSGNRSAFLQPLHHVSLHNQARQRKRDCRPRPRPQPKLRVRRHVSMK